MNENNHSFEVGQTYLIRTVTLHYTGRLVKITETDVVLEEAAWIASTGRYHECLRDGLLVLEEVEPYPDRVIVGRGGIIDAARWDHPLPRETK